MSKAYLLEVEKNEEHDLDYDAFCIPYEGNEFLGANLMGTRLFDFPTPIYFLTDFRFIEDWDCIDNDRGIPIISSKLLKALNEVGQFNHRSIPICMISDSYLKDRFDPSGNLKEEVPSNPNFCTLHLLEYTKVFDYQLSTFDADPDDETEVEYIDELVLKGPKNGFPPIFRIEEDLTLLFVSEEAKLKIESVGIRGCLFEEVRVSC
jgi:hypothetical protein